MFVSRSKYEDKSSELNQVQRDYQNAMSRIRELEAENAAMSEELSNQASQSQHQSGSVITQCLIDSMNQIAEVRDSVLVAYEQINAENTSNENIGSLFTDSSYVLEKLVQDMSGLSTQMGSMSDRISGLSETADNINKFVTTITSISDQTNLLALNAAIEAARAGDAGRGFSVVADEVRALANETNKSATEVSELVNGIIQSTQQAVSGVNELRSNNEALEGGITTLNTSYEQMVNYCDSMKQAIGDGAVSALAQTVKLDLLAWKADVYGVICGQSTKSANDLDNPALSRLSQSAQLAGVNSTLRELEAPLSAAHQYGTEAVRAYQSGDQGQLETKLVAMERESQRVLQLVGKVVS